MKFLFSIVLAALSLPCLVAAAFGYTDDGKNYVIDNGALLVFKVSKTNGDITSMVYNGVEYNGYDGKNSQVESGLGASTVTIEQFSDPAYIIKVTVTHGTLIHTYIARYKNDNIYMLTNKADNSVTALRYIVRLKGGVLPLNILDSDYYDAPSTTIEGGGAGDVTLSTNYGYTKSKHYTGKNYGRTMDYDYVGKASSSVGIWMIRSNHEKASGGPFFRSLLRYSVTGHEDLYEILYYNMGTVDPERFGLQGPYVLSFTAGGPPNNALFARKADWGWMDGLGIKDWVPSSARGHVNGVGIANMKSGFTYVVALSNSAAQYWATASPSGGGYSITKVLPGTYTLTVYKGELGVYTTTVTVSAGVGIALHTITVDDPSDDVAVWRIGDWDGSPAGFTNFDKTPMLPTYMHPSDKRLSTWNPPNFVVGSSSAASAMPGYIWMDVNNGRQIQFKLSAAQTATSHTIRIGITQAYSGGRPQISVNGWSSPTPAASNQAKTRSLTVGTYRGTNVMFTYNVPASAFLAAGQLNVLKINVVSGSTGAAYLSPGISLDCIDFL